jgi:hypothetical protein
MGVKLIYASVLIDATGFCYTAGNTTNLLRLYEAFVGGVREESVHVPINNNSDGMDIIEDSELLMVEYPFLHGIFAYKSRSIFICPVAPVLMILDYSLRRLKSPVNHYFPVAAHRYRRPPLSTAR